MRTVRAAAIIPAALLLFAACSSDAGGTTPAQGTTLSIGTASTLPGVPTTLPGVPGATTTAPPTEDASSGSAIDGPVQIDVVVGVDSAADRVELVKLGSDVTLNITNPVAADQFHVTVAEIDQQVKAGVTATINFIADQAGTYEVDSASTGDVLLVLEVE